MAKHNPANERVKRAYFTYLKEAKRQSEVTVDAVANALARFEADADFRDFKRFHVEQAMAFKRRLARQSGAKSGELLSQATQYATLMHLKRFFQWLAGQPGYKSRLRYSDAEYFNASDKSARVATARRQKPFPTLEQVQHVISRMPYGNDIERRNRALVAFILLTGARDSAVASMKLKHVNLAADSVFQDAREVSTKFAKTFTTYFFPVGTEIRAIVADWVTYLREVKLWDNNDPLFPATNVVNGTNHEFEASGLKRQAWRDAGPIRAIFREAFETAGLPYCNPHRIRDTLTHLGEARCQTAEEFKAWSQNLGHESVMTTLNSYGQIADRRQGEIIAGLAHPRRSDRLDVDGIAEALAQRLNARAVGGV